LAGVCVSLYAGRALANSAAPGVLVTVALVAMLGVVAFAIGTEYVLALLLVTAPIGLEQVTQNQRDLFPTLGGWAVSSLRLGVLLAAVFGLLALKGLPRTLTVSERVYLLLVAWLMLMLAVSPSLMDGIRFTAKVAALPCAWLGFEWVIRRFGSALVWRLLGWALVGTLVVDIALYVAGAELHGGPLGPERFGGIAGSPASGALSLALLSLVALYRWFVSRHVASLILYIAAWFFVFLSVTRIALLAFFISSLVLAALMKRRPQALLIAVVVLIPTFAYAPLRERMAWGQTAESWTSIYRSYQQQGTANLNLEGRLVLWQPLWDEFKQHPLTGSGTGASSEVLREASHKSLSTGGPGADIVMQAHSDYLALLTNGGVIALGLWLAALGGLLVRFARRSGPARIAAAGIVLYLIAAITDNAIEMYANVGIPLGAIIALSFAAARHEETETT
jgi:O-antigen ligase